MLKQMYKPGNDCQIKNLEQIYTDFFGYTSKGTFVEVGAYDGISFSNTSFLGDLGWSGVYIEPVNQFFEKCKERHKNNNIIFYNNAVGSEEKEIKIFVNGAISTTANDQISTYENINWANKTSFSTQVVKQLRLDTILKKANVKKKFDLLVVDVEGNENDVFKSFDLTEWMPRMMIVELVDNHPDFKTETIVNINCKILRNYINNNGYVEIYSDEINTIFIKK
jgi:FkbM family methyltransferase